MIDDHNPDPAAPSDETLDRLFGDEAIARERANRNVYVLKNRTSDPECILVPDTRCPNDAWNRRQGRGSKGDRRISRGGPGRR